MPKSLQAHLPGHTTPSCPDRSGTGQSLGGGGGRPVLPLSGWSSGMRLTWVLCVTHEPRQGFVCVAHGPRRAEAAA